MTEDLHRDWTHGSRHAIIVVQINDPNVIDQEIKMRDMVYDLDVFNVRRVIDKLDQSTATETKKVTSRLDRVYDLDVFNVRRIDSAA